ncbi:hypothetical protein, partial [Capnocytophaga canis]|uniref:hypothetical protein n=1 Tax=Capnocytophaga canis TaxID=1848903 RepID=UPI001E2CDC0E
KSNILIFHLQVFDNKCDKIIYEKYFKKTLQNFWCFIKKYYFCTRFGRQLAISLWRIAYSAKRKVQKNILKKKFAKVLVV